MKKIRYIGFYDLLETRFQKNSCLSAINKMNYIVEAINHMGIKVEIVSPSWYVDSNAPYTKPNKNIIDDNISLIQGPSFGTKNKITGKIKYYVSLIWLFYYLVLNVKKEEEILVYHSLPLMKPLLLAKKIKKFKIIYEIEEIYSDVNKSSLKQRKKELKVLSKGNKYIFSTELLSEVVNKASKPELIIYGTYKVEYRKSKINDDGKIHVVYAGTFDSRKGVIEAISCARYLDNKFHVHIIGFGNESEKINIEELIEKVSKETDCTITYDGLYKGEEYIKFIQSCHIGLCTQDTNASYNNTSFPSKILSYMSNGLQVVSIKIKSLESSKISNVLNFYESNTPSNIAYAIKKIDISKNIDNREIVKNLNKEFIVDLKKLLEG